ncbi:MAG: hypothetical protein DRJ05_03055 [Bacteroidetes bacterium]|nr:MAG: hypothetical protein DRJ05_03055 [Bacteroidota bacterium]
MKKILLFLLLFFTLSSYTQQITRGPDVGEIYFLGPTNNGEGLYYSTDFGETATFVDGSMNYISIAADKTQGGVYCTTLPIGLYYSGDYGYTNTWEFKYSDDYLSNKINSGIVPGHIFSSCWMHSEDYGSNFIVHSLNGWFGNLKHVTIDNNDENIGYALTYKLNVADTIYLFRTIDNFENVNIIQRFNLPNGIPIQLSSGNAQGEVYLFNKYLGYLHYSSDYTENFNNIDYYNFKDFYSLDFVGGKQTGELYLLYNFVNMMWQNAHIYIFHSTDYGKTFEVFHPFAKGDEPVLANFSTIEKEVFLTTAIEFSNFSIGDIQEHQWDFENDGTIDSYEEFPVHIYQDTGWYSVKLSVVGPDSTNSFIKEDYIHVIDTTTDINEIEKQSDKIKISPNPFSSVLTIQTNNKINSKVEIFNCKGEIVFETVSSCQSIIWDGSNITGKKCQPGIYYIKTNNSVNKVILSN